MNACTSESQDAAQLFDKLVDGDEQGCRDLVAGLLEGDNASVLSICEALTEAFYKVGDAWECDQISIYREHIASQIGYRILQDVRSSLASPDKDAPVAIGCTPEGDPYTLPTCMVELVLRDTGWNAHSLGTNLPLDELIPAIDHYKPQLCWVSASYTESPKRLRDQLLNLVEAGRIEMQMSFVVAGRFPKMFSRTLLFVAWAVSKIYNGTLLTLPSSIQHPMAPWRAELSRHARIEVGRTVQPM